MENINIYFKEEGQTDLLWMISIDHGFPGSIVINLTTGITPMRLWSVILAFCAEFNYTFDFISGDCKRDEQIIIKETKKN